MNYIKNLIFGVIFIEISAILGWLYSSSPVMESYIFFLFLSAVFIYLNYLSYLLKKVEGKSD
tara:strand:+ start:791 stop:976 length:186 start_codon:yes stop_codon:yes gene_type:complete